MYGRNYRPLDKLLIHWILLKWKMVFGIGERKIDEMRSDIDLI